MAVDVTDEHGAPIAVRLHAAWMPEHHAAERSAGWPGGCGRSPRTAWPPGPEGASLSS